MGTRVDDDSLEGLTPFQRNGYVKVETDGGTYFLARNQHDALEQAIVQGVEVFIGEDPRGSPTIIRLRYGAALTIDNVTDWTPQAIAAYLTEVALDKFRSD